MADGFSTQTQHKAGPKRLANYGALPSSHANPFRRHSTTSADAVTNARRLRVRHKTSPVAKTTEQTSPSLKVSHASPLAPLRSQDAKALESFFESEHIQETVLDIHRYIARIYPEPCWEDEPYEFLHGLI